MNKHNILFVPSNGIQMRMFIPVIETLLAEYPEITPSVLSLDEYYNYQTRNTLEPLKDKIRIISLHNSRNPQDIFHMSRLKRFFAYLEAQRRIMTLLATEKPSALILGNDNQELEMMFIHFSKKSGIKTILIQDGVMMTSITPSDYQPEKATEIKKKIKKALHLAGIYFYDKHPFYGIGGCDLILSSGKQSKDFFIKHGVQSEKIVIVGQAHYDHFISKAALQNPTLLRDNLQISSSCRIILWMTQPLIETEKISQEKINETIFSTAKQINFTNTCLVIKLHPRERAANYTTILKKLPEDQFNKVVILEATSPEEVIPFCDIFMTYFSTTALEALLFHKPVILLDYPQIPTHLGLERSGGAISIKDYPELESTIRKLLEDKFYQHKITKNAREALKSQIYKPDGKASKRICETIRKNILLPNT